jgi:hypothetical protein
MAYSQEELNSIVQALIIDNTTNQITPAKVRTVFEAVISSLAVTDAATVTATPPLYLDAFTNVFSILQANAETNGYLSKEDWAKFNAGSDKIEYSCACSDEVSDLTIGTLITFRIPFGITLTGVRLSINTAPTVTKIIVDIKKAGVSIFSTLASIDIGATTSVGASVPAVISTTNLPDDSVISINTTQVGSGAAGKGLKVTLLGKRI